MMPDEQEKFAQMLRDARLRPTRQRVALAELLFYKGDRHLSAESLYDEANAAGIEVSLATIYNTLHQFTGNGLLKAISIDSNRTYFDTNTKSHHHFLDEATNEVIDMPDGFLDIGNLPDPPAGREISGVDIVVRLRRLQD